MPGDHDPASPADAGQPETGPDAITPGAPAPAGGGSLIRVAFPRNVTAITSLGILIGLVLILIGLASRWFFVPTPQANMVTGIGAGVLLAAFGGQASARFGPFVLAGAVAISAFFVWFLNWSDQNAFERRSYFIGTIRDVDPKVFSINMRNKGTAYSRLEFRDYNFVAPRAEFEDGSARIEFEVKDRNRVPYCRERPADEDCVITFDISSKIFQEAALQDRSLQWRFNVNELQLYDIETNRKVQDTQVATLPANWQPPSLGALFSIAASAQTDMPVEDPHALATAMADLTSEDIDARRVARDALSAGPISWVTPIADRLLKDFDVYRVRLGCSVALAQMLRQNKKAASDVAGRLSPDHLDALLRATGDDDRTVRIYAGEFLMDLGDPRTVRPALDYAFKTDDDNARYNYVLVVQGAVGSADAVIRKEAAARLQELLKSGRVGPKTQEQIMLAIRQAG